MCSNRFMGVVFFTSGFSIVTLVSCSFISLAEFRRLPAFPVAVLSIPMLSITFSRSNSDIVTYRLFIEDAYWFRS